MLELKSQVRWCRSVILTLGRLRQGDGKFKASLDYLVSSRQPGGLCKKDAGKRVRRERKSKQFREQTPTYPWSSFSKDQFEINLASSIPHLPPPTSDYFEVNLKHRIILSINISVCIYYQKYSIIHISKIVSSNQYLISINFPKCFKKLLIIYL